jgi:hypothetical protein
LQLKSWKSYFLSDVQKNFQLLMKLPQFEFMRTQSFEVRRHRRRCLAVDVAGLCTGMAAAASGRVHVGRQHGAAAIV